MPDKPDIYVSPIFRPPARATYKTPPLCRSSQKVQKSPIRRSRSQSEWVDSRPVSRLPIFLFDFTIGGSCWCIPIRKGHHVVRPTSCGLFMKQSCQFWNVDIWLHKPSRNVRRMSVIWPLYGRTIAVVVEQTERRWYGILSRKELLHLCDDIRN
jgi:hypothetical protein